MRVIRTTEKSRAWQLHMRNGWTSAAPSMAKHSDQGSEHVRHPNLGLERATRCLTTTSLAPKRKHRLLKTAAGFQQPDVASL